jgi:replicative DNA helicase
MDITALPKNYEAEVEILGSILKNNNNILEAVEIINDSDFYRDSHKHIYKAMFELYKENKTIDIVTLSTKLAPTLKAIGGITYITELFNTSIGNSIKNHCELVKEASNKRQIIKSCNMALEAAYKQESNAKEIVSEFENSLLDLEKEKNKLISSSELIEKTIGFIENNYRKGGGYIGMECGIKTIDSATDGFIKKDLVVLAGRPSMGKTLLAMQIAKGLSKKNKVALFELEMNDENLGIRLLSNKTKINGVRLRRGDLQDTEWGQVANAAASLSQSNLWVDTSSTQTIYDIKSKCKKMKLRHGLDCVIVDHIGLLEGSKNISQENRNLLIGEITRQAKIIAKELDVNVILLSQLSRKVEERADKRPMMSDLRESGNIEQDADLILFVYRDEYYNPDTENKNIMELIVAKQRNGKTGKLDLYCDLKTQTIGDLSIR